ncbi:MAG: hypothetical protein ACLRMZ_26555 [Blautia marasmi]
MALLLLAGLQVIDRACMKVLLLTGQVLQDIFQDHLPLIKPSLLVALCSVLWMPSVCMI